MYNNIKAVYSTSLLQMKNSFARATFQFCIIVQPIFMSIVMYMIYQGSQPEYIISYVIIGSGMLSLWSAICFSSAGDIERERYMGTLELITSVPVNFKLILLGKILGNTILGLVPLVISFTFITVFFNITVVIPNIPMFILSLTLTILSFIPISLLISCAFTLSRQARVLMNCIEYPIYILCGIVFPVEILPAWTKGLSYILSPTWGIRIIRSSVFGIENMSVFTGDVIRLTVLSLIYTVFSLYLVGKIDRLTRINATLGVH